VIELVAMSSGHGATCPGGALDTRGPPNPDGFMSFPGLRAGGGLAPIVQRMKDIN